MRGKGRGQGYREGKCLEMVEIRCFVCCRSCVIQSYKKIYINK